MAESVSAPRVSIVVLSWNTRDLLAACLLSLRAVRDEIAQQVIVVDNASEDGSADMVAERFPEVTLVRNASNAGYAGGNNIGARAAVGEYLLLLNSDTEMRPGVLADLVAFLDEHPGHGACAPRLEHADGTVQRSCKAFPDLMTAVFFDTYFDRWFPRNRAMARYFMRDFDHLTSRDVDQPPGAAFLIRRTLWEELGGLDEELWLYFNDVDLCLRLHRAGHKIAYRAEQRVLHHEGKSTSRFPRMGAMWHRNRRSYYRKHLGPVGVLLAKVMTVVRGFEEWRRLSRERAPEEARRDVWRAVWEVCRG